MNIVMQEHTSEFAQRGDHSLKRSVIISIGGVFLFVVILGIGVILGYIYKQQQGIRTFSVKTEPAQSTPIPTLIPMQSDWQTWDINYPNNVNYQISYPQKFDQLFAGAGTTCQPGGKNPYVGTNECIQADTITDVPDNNQQTVESISDTLTTAISEYGNGLDKNKTTLLQTHQITTAEKVEIFKYNDGQTIVLMGIGYENDAPLVGISFTITNPDTSILANTINELQSILYTMRPVNTP